MAHIVISLGEKLDKATGLMSEALAILEKPEVRAEMIINAPLGEMGETECLEKALVKAEEALKILNEYRPEKSMQAQEVINKINARIKVLTQPPEPPKPPKRKIKVIEKKEDDVKKAEPKKTSYKKKGVKTLYDL